MILILRFQDGGWVALGGGRSKEGYNEESLASFLCRLREEGIDYEVKEIARKMKSVRSFDDDYFEEDINNDFDM